MLFDTAKRAGIGRIVHISITNPDRNSDLPYFSGKAEMEDHLKSTGLSYAILRPTVLFGKEDILINNIAWALRHLPVFGIYGDGRYRLQPIYVDDLAAVAVACITGETNETIDAIGPETFRYSDMVEMIAREIASRAPIVPMPPMLAYQSIRMLGWLVHDVITTPDEIKGLMEERLYVDAPPSVRAGVRGGGGIPDQTSLHGKFPAIPRSRHDPKIFWVDDAEIVGDRITKVRPVPRNLFTQKTERRIGELGASCVALVVSDVSVHGGPITVRSGSSAGNTLG